MVTKFITHIEPDTSLVGRLRSRQKVVTWEYNKSSGEFENPGWEDLHVSQRLPTTLSKHLDSALLEKSIVEFKERIRTLYQEKLDKVNEKLATKKRESKVKTKLEEEKAALEYLFEHFDKLICLTGPYVLNEHAEDAKYSTYQLRIPNLTKSDTEFLPDIFIKKESVNRVAKNLVKFPFGKFINRERGDLKPLQKRIDLETLVKGKGLAKDYETTNWQRIRVQEELREKPIEELKERYTNLVEAYEIEVDQRVLPYMSKTDLLRGIENILDENKGEGLTTSSMINLANGDNYLITTLDCGKDFIMVDVPGKDKKVKVKIIHVENQDELIKWDNKLMEEINPLFVYGHNHLSFDHPKAEELTGNYRPGVGRTKPKVLAADPKGGDIKKKNVLRFAPGRFDIDPSGYSQNYMYTYKNSLDAVLEHLLGIVSKKTMTHDELAVKTAKAEKGSTKDAEDILYYAAQDSMKSWLMGETVKREHLLLARAYNSIPARIDCVGKKTLAKDYWVNWHFNKKNTYPRGDTDFVTVEDREFGEFSSSDFMHKDLKNSGIRISGKNKRKGLLVQLFPYVKSMKDIFFKDENVKAIYTRIRESDDEKEKSRLLTSLDSIVEYPLFKTIHNERRTFGAEFEWGPRGYTAEGYRKNIQENMSLIKTILRDYQPLNSKENLFVLPADTPEHVLRQLTKDNLGIILGEGTVYSIGKGRFAASIDDEFVMQGIADPQSKKGERCDFERNFYETFLNYIVREDKIEEAIQYLDERAKELSTKRYDPPEIEFARNVRKDYFEYSAGCKQKYVKHIIANKCKKGDLISYQYTHEEMLEKFFGIKQQGSSENSWSTGTISSIVEAALPEQDNLTKTLLKRIYQGRGTEDDIQYIVNAIRNEPNLRFDENPSQGLLFPDLAQAP